MPTKQHTETMNRLRRECTKLGIRYTCRIASIPRLEAMIADPYPYQLSSFARYWGLEPFDFRAKGIEPKPGAWVRWRPTARDIRPKVRGHGRFVRWDGEEHAIVRYDFYDGFRYKSRQIRVQRFQITDYREDR